ncbi:uncharacterized zinc finger protein At4g06634 isoform X3 [Amborella trichopoda]|uniref:uncharacterized zinc finger protein At4g06634 isoform X3 n=1 Tax=Amborella trichopoda TaxID=13333 RepID=UPI0009C042FE|nr:uncharacterized zinc finger protein At4g06634 isoform X3 [Amborella trichopoda]|eukprot:XP_020517881.1 uncharacterized zinc finger protein At4g06634 isoform X3 [Amborella trichopoda]
MTDPFSHQQQSHVYCAKNMDPTAHHLLMRDSLPPPRLPPPAVKWFKEWVPQETVSGAGNCSLLKWVTEDTLKALKERYKEPEPVEPEPEPRTEVLYLCTYEGCGKTFVDAGAIRKHSHIHGERQYVCHYDGCGRKFLSFLGYAWSGVYLPGCTLTHWLVFISCTVFMHKFLDSSKLKRHFLIHTGDRPYTCPHEGCGKAFSLDFNLRAHMRTHSQENYHICPYGDCGKRYAHEYKLKAHIKSHHEKNLSTDVKHTPQAEKPHNTPKTPALVYGSASSDRPYSCPYEGCDKAYIHEYKLNLHLKREHPGHNSEENGKHNVDAENEADEGSDPDAYNALKSGNGKSSKRSKVKLASKAPAAKTTQRKGMGTVTLNTNPVAKPWTSKGFVDEEDSEETEEDRDNGEEEGWQYGEANEDDEETEYED